MSKSPSSFIWYELMTTDTVAAQAFYSAVVGWGTKDMHLTEEKYTLFTVADTGVAGLMTIPKQACAGGKSPGWVGYIAVENVDASAEQIKQKGGAVHFGPEDIPEVGRFAAVSDPHGAIFMLLQPEGEPPADMPAPETPGLCAWRELHAGNGPEAFDFYSELFAWQKAGAMPMGDLGEYQMFSSGSEAVGAIMTKCEDMPKPQWMYYFNVEAIDAAIARVNENGGRIIMGPHEVPGDLWIVQGCDPQGAAFALVAPKK
jgi:hypothetical protein